MIPIKEEMDVPFEFHRYIIGQKGNEVRKMMEEYDVNISIPPAVDKSNKVAIQGAPSNVSRAKEGLAERVTQLEGEQKDRVSHRFFQS